MRFRLAAVSAVACALAALLCAGQALAAAEVHRLNLVFSGIPTQVQGGDFNDALDTYNARILQPRGYQTMDHVQFTWAYDAELRYFVRPSFALTAGITQLRASQDQHFLPAITQSVNVSAEILTVPVHIGAMYYLQAYNQGDFQARAYLGGGLMQYTYTRATFKQALTTADPLWTAPDTTYGKFSNYRSVITQDGPGFYLEGGAHMFFAARYSVIIGAIYRSGKLNNARVDRVEGSGQVVSGTSPGPVVTNSKGQPYQLDVGGLGVKMALAVGF